MSGAQYNSKEREYNGDLQLEESLWPKFKFYRLLQLRSVSLCRLLERCLGVVFLFANYYTS